MRLDWIFYALLFHGYTAFIISTPRTNPTKAKTFPTSVSHPSNDIHSNGKFRSAFPSRQNRGLRVKEIATSNTILAQTTTFQADLPSTTKPSILPAGDEIDSRIFRLALPAILNFAIIPLVGAADTFWVGRMKSALALAGQGAANQLFSSSFWFFSFLPSVVTPLVAKAQGAGDMDSLRARVSEALFIATIMGILGTVILGVFPAKILSLVLKDSATTRIYAEPYLAIRALTLLPALLSTVGFAVFRGTQDVITPLKISIVSNLINVILDPILIFFFGFGVTGAAVATCIAEFTSFLLYGRVFLQKQFIEAKKLFQIPSLKAMLPLLIGGLTMQLRAVALNTALIAVTRATQQIDSSGTAAAAHAISLQLFQLGSIASLAMSTVSSIMIPLEVAKAKRENTNLQNARLVSNRLLIWGLIVGFSLALLQLASLPLISFFSPLTEVQEAAKIPSMIGALLQLLNCFVWTGEGIQQGNEDFLSIALATIGGTIGMLIALRYAGNSLAKVWGSFIVLSGMRMIGVLRHHFFTSPLLDRKR